MDIKGINFEQLDEEQTKREEQYQRNCNEIQLHKYNQEKACKKLAKKEALFAADKSAVGNMFNLNKTGGKITTAISFIPTGAMLVPTVLGMVGVGLGMIPLLLNAGAEFTSEELKVINTIEHFIESSGKLSLQSAEEAVKTLIVPTAVGMLTIPKTKFEEWKARKRERNFNEMATIDDLVLMIEDLNNGKNDINLNFIKELLSNTDIRKNTYSYNLELLFRLSEYRTCSMQEEAGILSHEDTTEAFMNIIYFLSESSKKDGASKRFLESEYIQNLINTYNPKEENIFQNQLVKRR